jgi:hypothetical protein
LDVKALVELHGYRQFIDVGFKLLAFVPTISGIAAAFMSKDLYFA